MHIVIFGLGIILFIGLVLVHEWGHYIMARRNNVDVEEFGLGFPPRAGGKRLKSGMILSVNYLPLGGFVKMKGENDSDTRKGSFGAASMGAKTKIMLAGVTMNLIVGLGILTILALVGMPKLLTQDNVGQDQFTVASDTKITHQAVLTGPILDNSPAKKAGLKSTDTLVSIKGDTKTYTVNTPAQVHDATLALAGQNVTVTSKRDGQLIQTPVQLLSFADIINGYRQDAKLNPGDKVTKITYQKTGIPINNDQDFYSAALNYSGVDTTLSYTNNGRTYTKTVNFAPRVYLGIQPTTLQIQRSTWSAPIVAVGLTKQIIVLTFSGLGHALAGLGSLVAGGVTGNHEARVNGQDQASSQVGGPVAIGMALWSYGNLGIYFMLFLIALISLTLAIMNILPIPALDGGRLAMMLISRGILKRPLTPSAEEKIVGASFALLLGLIVLITLVDVKRFF